MDGTDQLFAEATEAASGEFTRRVPEMDQINPGDPFQRSVSLNTEFLSKELIDFSV